MERTASLFRNGENQAVRILREFELPDTKAVMREDGNRLIVEAAAKPSLLDVIDALPAFEDGEGLDPVETPPLDPVDL